MGQCILLFVLLIGKSTKLMDLVVVGNVSGFTVLKMILLIMPSFLSVTLPMTVLLGSVLALGRLSADSEITAMMASGISFNQIAVPIFFISFLGYLLALFLNLFAVPKFNTELRKTVMKNVQQTIIANIQEGVFNDKMGNIVMYVRHIDKSSGKFRGIFIADYKSGEKPTTIFAKDGRVFIDPTSHKLNLLLQDGVIQLAEQKNTLKYGEVSFKKYRISIDVERLFNKARGKFKQRREWSLARLRAEIEKAKKLQAYYLAMQVELVKKFSMPVSCFIFGIIAMPLGINTRRGNKMSGLPVCVGLFIFYYVLWNACENLGKTALLDPYYALWIPNLTMGVFSAFLFLRARKIPQDSGLDILPRIKEIFGKAH